jgi:hypothetical protein
MSDRENEMARIQTALKQAAKIAKTGSREERSGRFLGDDKLLTKPPAMKKQAGLLALEK